MDRRLVARRALASACLVAVAFSGGSAGVAPGPASPDSRGLGSARAGALVLAGLFSPRELASMTAAEIDQAARDLAESARGTGREREALVRAFPPPQAVLASLALDRDVDDFVEASAAEGPAGAHYRRSAALSMELRPLRGAYERLYAAACETLAPRAREARASRAAAPLSGRGDLLKPDRRLFRLSHPFALDFFFRESAVARRGAAESGPVILSLSPGIVIAAAGDWRGGAGIGAWKGGGLSPAAGNGVVVYDPAGRKYYSYFHLSEVGVLPGQVLERGRALGRGGNTGMNARKEGHGGHIHVEIFDAAEGRALGAEEIMAAVSL